MEVPKEKKIDMMIRPSHPFPVHILKEMEYSLTRILTLPYSL
jgi:hypothetical protein